MEFPKKIIYSILFTLLAIKEVLTETGKEKGAYLSVPNSNNLQYRLGNGLGYIGN